MKKFTIVSAILLTANVLLAQIIHIPADYPTIQQGINAASPGDTVLVSPGTYLENLNYSGKNITVASLFLTTQDPAYISQTVIDGHQAGSVVSFNTGEDSTALFCGFTVTNGRGGIYCNGSNPTLRNLIIEGNTNPMGGWGWQPGGGGICCVGSDPIVRNVTITNNTSSFNGGGILCVQNSSPVLSNVTIAGNTASLQGGGIYCESGSVPLFDSINRCNIFLNSALEGNDIFSNALLEVIVDTFTVLNPHEFHAAPLANFTFDILHGKAGQVNADLYVSPVGNNSNSGLTATEPLKTIHHALSIILADTTNPHTIHLLEGKYSSFTNNEFFPIILPGFISLAGVSDTTVILDADSTSRVIHISNNFSSHISGMTITGGLIALENGGGIICRNSRPVLENLVIKGNFAGGYYTWGGINGGYGGGIYSENSSPVLQHVKFFQNTAYYGGAISSSGGSPVLEDVLITGNLAQRINYGWGGDYWYGGRGGGADFVNSTPKLQHVEITQNTAYAGGGISNSGSGAILEDVTITYNTASSQGGGIWFDGSGAVFDSIDRCNIYFNTAPEGREMFSNTVMELIADTFSVLHPTAYYVEPLDNFSFNILHGKIAQVDADIYVAPWGDNANSGLSDTVPLRNISYAFPFMRADSLHHHTIHLLDGSYGSYYNNETFPIIIPDYIDLEGTNKAYVSLVGNNTTEVITFRNNTSSRLSGMTITGGNNSGIRCFKSNPVLESIVLEYNSAARGGGLFCDQSSPTLRDVDIIYNTANDNYGNYSGAGGGVYCGNNSNPLLQHVTITNNYTVSGGGIYCDGDCNPILQNVDLSNNSATGAGGGAFVKNATFDSVRINDNSASEGGGINFWGNLSFFKNVMITGNSADLGGGVYCSFSNLADMTITGNTASRQGGGIYFTAGASVFDSISRCNIYFNEAPEGRDLFTNSVVKVIADTFTVLHPTAYYAEPIDKFSFNVLHGKIAQADADVYVSPSGNNSNSGLNAGNPLKTMDHAFSIMRADNQHQHSIHLAEGRYCPYTNKEQFPVNIPDYIDIKGANKLNVIFDAVGGARVMNFNNNSSSHVSGITITGGYVAEANGGGVMFNNSSPTMEDMIITGNNAASGGGIFCGYNSNPTLRDIIISNNNAAGSGGGIVCGANSAPAFINVSILGNSAATGGGIGCFNLTAPVFKNVTITGNLAYDGGGIYCAGNVDLNQMLPVKIENGKISNNFASRGGGVCCDFSKFTGVNLEITDNTATWGGGLYCNISRPVLQNMTLSGNRADSAGGGMYCRSDTRYLISKITNSIVWNNFPQEIYLKPSNAMNAVILSYSDLKGGEGSIVTTGQDTVLWLEGNINQDPLFTGSGAYPYSLQAGSPCRNTGTPDTTGLFLPLTDLAGEPRIWDGRIDMGAYEWNNVGVADLRFTIYDLRISNYPNPFSVITTFSYELTESSKVTLQIYNNLGQLVDELVNTTQPKGDQKVEWNAKNLPAGIYFFLIRAGKQEGNGKMIKL